MDEKLPRRIAWFAPWTWKRRWWIATAVVLIAAYPLSMGPAWGLMAAGKVSRDTIKTAYRPIFFVSQHRPEVNPILNWYLDLFE